MGKEKSGDEEGKKRANGGKLIREGESGHDPNKKCDKRRKYEQFGETQQVGRKSAKIRLQGMKRDEI